MTRQKKYKGWRGVNVNNEFLSPQASNLLKIMHTFHDEHMRNELEDTAAEQASWARHNIHIGAVVKTNVNYYMEETDIEIDGLNVKVGSKTWVLNRGTNMMFLGFHLKKCEANTETAELLEQPTYKVWHKWLINGRTLLADIHPFYFSLEKNGTGNLWLTELIDFCEQSWKQVMSTHVKVEEPKLLTPKYDDYFDFWSGEHVDNPVRIPVELL